jgi:hypothetical protein
MPALPSPAARAKMARSASDTAARLACPNDETGLPCAPGRAKTVNVNIRAAQYTIGQNRLQVLFFIKAVSIPGRQSFSLSAGSTPVKGLTLIRKNK